MNMNAFVNIVGGIAMLEREDIVSIQYTADKDKNIYSEDILLNHRAVITFSDRSVKTASVDEGDFIGSAISILEKIRGW